MDDRRSRPEKTGGLRDLVLEEELKIRWTHTIRNEEVYRGIDEGRTLWNNIEKRRTRCIVHTLRHNRFVKNIIEGK
jgi:hypothetical protein